MQRILKSQATANMRNVYFDAVDDSDGKTPLQASDMSATFIVKWSVNGGAAVTPTGSAVTQVDATNQKGLFYVQLAAADVGSNGVGVLDVQNTGGTKTMRRRKIPVRITLTDDQDGVRGGMTALPNAAAQAAGGLITRGTGAGQVNQDANGRIDVNLAAWKGTAPNALQAGRVDSYVGALAAAVISAANYANDVDMRIVRTGTAQAGAAGSITLDAGASATDNAYKGQRVRIISGTGSGQSRRCTGYVGATKVATVDRNWLVNPDVTSVFQVLFDDDFVEAHDEQSPTVFTQGETDATKRTISLTLIDAATGELYSGALANTDIQIHPFGGAWANATNAPVQVSAQAGSWELQLAAAEVATAGPLWVRVVKDGVKPMLLKLKVSALSPGDEVFGALMEGAVTFGDGMRLMASVLAGKASGFNTNTITFNSLDGTKVRLTVTVDPTGRTGSTTGDLT